ncbi:hypothetical protein B0H66DRAFT_577732 [Apodospora peruviana]|uniref:Uncharacterized protein n=1 Tax=Apodospora peruviana TaxID=516989 RepID=A0AAE0HVX5_9PEZI|nr:hypothetical protein B0H66DRAFT_577732 [Apodospora peruviana]
MSWEAVSAVQDNSSQPSEGVDNDDEDEDEYTYGYQDDAQSFIQPAISPIATRLTSPKTPAAERAAAMDQASGGGLFSMLDVDEPNVAAQRAATFGGGDAHGSHHSLSGASTTTNVRLNHHIYNGRSYTMSQVQTPQPQPLPVSLPTPWQAGPKKFLVAEATSARSAMSGVFGSESRNRRSSSISENALKRLSKALPSISIPTPSFFLSTSSQKDDSTVQPQKSAPLSGPTPNVGASASSPVTSDAARQGPPRPSSRLSYALRKSTSDDSLLYHSLSRVSSLGDDDRFANIREQVNSRLKAIKDSWDGPTFKLPQFPSLLTPPLKKVVPSPTDPSLAAYRSHVLQAGPRAYRDGISPLDSILASLTGDIVVMGGYRGSILRSSQPPYRQLWVPVKVGLNFRKVNMEVGLDPEDEEKMEEHIFASGMLQNIGPVDISKRLFKKLRECENARKVKLRVHDYGYDWRLSPHLLSRRLIAYLEKLPCNQPHVPKEQRGAWVIAHSLGGLMTRHAVNQRPELFAGVVYAGVPQRCINILGPLRNGDAVLLNEKVLTAQVHFSLRTTFAFLPEDGFCFIDKVTKEEYPIDFYNIEEWIKYRISPCVSEPALPPLLSKSSTFSSLLGLSDSLPSLPLRNRSMSQQKKDGGVLSRGGADIHTAIHKDRTLTPQVGSSSSANTANHSTTNQSSHKTRAQSLPQPMTNVSDNNTYVTNNILAASSDDKNLVYLARTLAETKRFRAELAHDTRHQEANAYPPLAVIYAKDIPTVYAARVAGREGIACADAYDDLVFRSGDGVVLAREAMLPEGYELVKDGRVCTDRGHVTLLGDLSAVGRALEAVVRGRRKGIGFGISQNR